MSVSVAIPTRNRRDGLLRLLKAVLPQAVDCGADVLVVDNGSTDGTAEAIRALADGGVRCVEEPTPGATRARNRAAGATHADVLAFIDDDTVPREGWLAGILAPFADPLIGCVGGRVVLDFLAPPPPWWDGTLADFLSAYDLGTVPIDLGTLPWYASPRGANMAVRRDAVLAVGGFNLRLGPRQGRPSVGEESDLCLRLRARGYEVRYEPTSTVEHLIDPARLAPAWLFRRAFWNGWAEAIIGLSHRPLRKSLGLIRWYYRPRLLRAPYHPRGDIDPTRLRHECERREALGYVLSVLRHVAVRGRLSCPEAVG